MKHSPLTYMMGGWAGTALNGRKVVCSQEELAVFNPPANQTCRSYLTPYFEQGAFGYLNNPNGMSACEYCPFQSAKQYLQLSSIDSSQRYRNLGIGYGFIVFNVVVAVWFYYFFRVKRVSLKGPARLMQRIFASQDKLPEAKETNAHDGQVAAEKSP